MKMGRNHVWSRAVVLNHFSITPPLNNFHVFQAPWLKTSKSATFQFKNFLCWRARKDSRPLGNLLTTWGGVHPRLRTTGLERLRTKTKLPRKHCTSTPDKHTQQNSQDAFFYLTKCSSWQCARQIVFCDGNWRQAEAWIILCVGAVLCEVSALAQGAIHSVAVVWIPNLSIARRTLFHWDKHPLVLFAQWLFMTCDVHWADCCRVFSRWSLSPVSSNRFVTTRRASSSIATWSDRSKGTSGRARTTAPPRASWAIRSSASSASSAGSTSFRSWSKQTRTPSQNQR